MGSTIQDELWRGLGVFSYVLKISSVSISLCLGLGSLWLYFGIAVYAALGFSVVWNKLDACYTFCISIGTWLIWIERNLVLQWYAFRSKENRCTLGLHRIIGSLIRYKGACGHQVWSFVSLNHRQTLNSLYKIGFGNPECCIICTVKSCFPLWFHKEVFLIWSKLVDSSCVTQYILRGCRSCSYKWYIMMLDRGLISILTKHFKQELLIHYLEMQEEEVRINVLGFTMAKSIMEPKGRWGT